MKYTAIIKIVREFVTGMLEHQCIGVSIDRTPLLLVLECTKMKCTEIIDVVLGYAIGMFEYQSIDNLKDKKSI